MSEKSEIVATIVDSDDLDIVRVLKDSNGMYHVEGRGVIRHPKCTAEDAIRALAHYAQAKQFELDSLKD